MANVLATLRRLLQIEQHIPSSIHLEKNTDHNPVAINHNSMLSSTEQKFAIETFKPEGRNNNSPSTGFDQLKLTFNFDSVGNKKGPFNENRQQKNGAAI